MHTLSQSPTDPEFVQNPYPFYREARAAGPLFHWRDYDHPCAISHTLVSAILRDPRFGREHPDGPPSDWPDHLAPFYALEVHSMLEREPPVHTRLRRLVMRAFTSRSIAALEPDIATLSADLVAGFPSGSFDLLATWAERIPVIIIARMLGVPEDMCPQLLSWSHDIVAMYQARRDLEVERRAARAASEFAAFMEDHIALRRAQPGATLLDDLIAAEADGARLSTPELISTAILLLNAGHEATVHALGNGVRALLTESDGPAERLPPERIDKTVEEILRYDPPLHMFTRFARAEVEVAGHVFAPGETVGLLLAAANRDPDVWADPDRFDPARSIKPHTSLGGGIHFCVGAPLARLEMSIALPTLFRLCPKLTLSGTPQYANRYHFRGLESLMVSV